MSTNPCKVCGGSELNLVDGYYYCVECGTQDVDVRETIVEQTVLADGTFAQVTSKKFSTLVQDGIEMNGEWYKWHAYNFILAGLTDELISLGAAPSVKMKVLWIWTRYIQKFQVKEDYSKTSNLDDESMSNNNKSHIESEHSDGTGSEDKNDKKTENKRKSEKFRKDIKIITKATLLTILYVALNLDRSSIQLSHLFRFIEEERLSVYNCIKFIPKELNTKSIPFWNNFLSCHSKCTQNLIREISMTFFKRLDLGVPIVPDLNNLINIYIKELCLPLDFRDLVFSLVHIVPCDYLQIDFKSMKSLVRTPDYEGVTMSYVLLGLKLCFGLDDDYEIRLSDVVEEINFNENYSKSYNLGFQLEPSDRLFSFRDWYKYIQFRKAILSKYYIHSAQLYNLPIDDYILMEQLRKRNKERVRLSDDVAMDILNKIPQNNIPCVISKSEFPPTLTPFTVYTEVVGQFIQDPDVKLLLSEDFSQYSLKYITQDLKLPVCINPRNLIRGVSKKNKHFNSNVVGSLEIKAGDLNMVFVRNCENKNWLQTRPPTIDHITKITEDHRSDEESDHGYDSNIGDSPNKIHETVDLPSDTFKENSNKTIYCDERVSIIDEEDIDKNIFDDTFEIANDYGNDLSYSTIKEETQHSFEFECNTTKLKDNDHVINECTQLSENSMELERIDPDKIDRNIIIQELIEIACKKYRIPVPRKETEENKPRKRKINTPIQKTDETEVKKRKYESKEKRIGVKNAINDLITAYYRTIEDNIIDKIQQHVKRVIENVVVEEAESNVADIPCNIRGDTNNDLNSIHSGQNEMISASNENEISLDQNLLDTTTVFEYSKCGTNIDEEERMSEKMDPNYDASTHDISQLYVKLDGDLDIEDIFDVKDKNLEEIVVKKIEEFANSENDVVAQPKKLDDKNDFSDSDDDLPLSVIKEEKLQILAKRKSSKLKFEPLFTTAECIKKYNYWLRHYKSSRMTKRLDMSEKFDFEINTSCPKSFVFVINECANILNCSTFSLYKCLQNIETSFMKLND